MASYFRMRNIFNDDDTAALMARVDRLDPSLPRQWGLMSAHQAVCHLNDAMKGILGERLNPVKAPRLKRRLVKFIGFTLPFPWPKGTVKTSRMNDQLQDGTKPGVFSNDVAELRRLVDRLRETKGRGLPVHYAWGDMSPAVLGRYVYRHIDHHLKQFAR